MDLDATLLRTFLACVRNGSISRAALVLGRSQPAVSQQLRRLEDLIGEPVLRRTPTGVRVTVAGDALLPYAERILGLTAEALLSARGEASLTGRCGVGLLEDLATPSLSIALAEFATRHPEVTLEVAMLPGPAMREAFDSGRVQLVLGDAAYFDQPSVWSTRLPLVWAASPGLALDQNPLPLALFSQPCRWRAPVQQALDRAGRAWKVAFESTAVVGLLAGVRAGLGATALLPASVTADLIHPAAATLPVLPEVEISLMRRGGADSHLIDAIQALLIQLA